MEILILLNGALYRIDGQCKEDKKLYLEEVETVRHKFKGIEIASKENYIEVDPLDILRSLTIACEEKE
jgi:hypothetical protein